MLGLMIRIRMVGCGLWAREKGIYMKLGHGGDQTVQTR